MAYTSKSAAPVRRGQLIAPFGVGALITNQDSTSMVCGALDHWYDPDDIEDITDFVRKEDWRLLARLGLEEVRLPPDYRENHFNSSRDEGKNFNLTIDAYRFPRWHVCPICRRMRELPLTARSVRCEHCEPKGKYRKPPEMYQVRFVAVCDHGHLQDFPWREWVHRTVDPDCNGPLKLTAGGGASLASIHVRCEGCDVESRSLAGITRGGDDPDQSFLSNHLRRDGGVYPCQGKKPWTGATEGEDCNRPLRATLRNASNVYFAETISSIYLPESEDSQINEIVSTLRSPKFSMVRSMMDSNPDLVFGSMDDLRRSNVDHLGQYSNEQIEEALRIVATAESDSGDEGDAPNGDQGFVEGGETSYRHSEFEALQSPRQGPRLTIRDEGLSSYTEDTSRLFNGIKLVDRLQVTHVLTGFTRLTPSSDDDLSAWDQRQLLWDDHPQRWLPASVVQGEGIFLRLNEERIRRWEERDDVRSRIAPLQHRYETSRHYDPGRTITPRFVMVHTLAHVLINQLVFECGYSTAALRERLYVSGNSDTPMAGLLIYTASGDSDGTMGGLVRMGQPGRLETVLVKALRETEWCSADPICMEAGERGGQGPESLNLAACHNCGLTPETSCEEFNRFLDRGLLIGFGERASENGYFSEMVFEDVACSA